MATPNISQWEKNWKKKGTVHKKCKNGNKNGSQIWRFFPRNGTRKESVVPTLIEVFNTEMHNTAASHSLNGVVSASCPPVATYCSQFLFHCCFYF